MEVTAALTLVGAVGSLAPGPDHQTVPVTALVRSSTVSWGQMAAQVLLPFLISGGIPAEVPQFFYLSNGIIFIFFITLLRLSLPSLSCLLAVLYKVSTFFSPSSLKCELRKS